MTSKTRYKYPLVRIVWIDAESGNTEWTTPEDISVELPVVTSVGFLVKESIDTYVIASTITEDHINGQFKIPKGMTKTKEVLSITVKKDKPTPKSVKQDLSGLEPSTEGLLFDRKQP